MSSAHQLCSFLTMGAFQTLAGWRQLGKQTTQLDSRPKKETGPTYQDTGRKMSQQSTARGSTLGFTDILSMRKTQNEKAKNGAVYNRVSPALP